MSCACNAFYVSHIWFLFVNMVYFMYIICFIMWYYFYVWIFVLYDSWVCIDSLWSIKLYYYYCGAIELYLIHNIGVVMFIIIIIISEFYLSKCIVISNVWNIAVTAHICLLNENIKMIHKWFIEYPEFLLMVWHYWHLRRFVSFESAAMSFYSKRDLRSI